MAKDARLAAWRSRRENGKLEYPSHVRPVLVHLPQAGFVSSHLTLRILHIS
jgi:hypothetical protein